MSQGLVETTVLLALCWLLARGTVLRRQRPSQGTRLVEGICLGGLGVASMMWPLVEQAGLIVDARSVFLAIAALFGGQMVAAVAGLMALAFSLFFDSNGALTEFSLILLPLACGLAYRHAHERHRLALGAWPLLSFSLLMHVLLMGLLLSISPASSVAALWPPLLALTAFTTLLGLLLHDLRSRERSEQALKQSDARLKAITRAIPDQLLVLDEKGRCLEVISDHTMPSNPLFGLHVQIGDGPEAWLDTGTASHLLAFIQQTLVSDRPQATEHTQQTEDGDKIYAWRAHPLDAKDPDKRAVVMLIRDISDHANAELERRIASLAFESQQGMLIADAEKHILRVNRAFSEISGFAASEAIGQTTRLLSSGNHGPEFYREMWRCVNERGAWQGEIWNRRKNGELFPEWLSISVVHDERGKATHYVAAFTDITERKAAEAHIHNLAFYDPLTGLANRRLLLDRLQQALATVARSKRSGALMFIDLDNFKHINDAFGHQAGDDLLCEAAKRLERSVRASDTVARLGGDEFVVMLENLDADPEIAAAQTEQVGMQLLTALSAPFMLGDNDLHTSGSVGATLFGAADTSADELMKRADMAMYEAKASGKNALRFFDPRMQEVVNERLQLEDQIRRGLNADEFMLLFQPQLEQTLGLTGAEALVRWQHPQRGLLEPKAFIAAAERAGLIQTLDFVVLQAACQQLARWATVPHRAGLTLAVNLSAKLLYQNGFVERLLDLLETSGAEPRKLMLELSESNLVDDMPEAIVRMNRLKARGIRFSIDNFGTGYSSMTYLQQLPVEQLKIDQSFVARLPDDDASLTIIRATCALAAGLGVSVVADGVENEAQRLMLLDTGCRLFQGYLFGRPMPLEAFEELGDALRRPQAHQLDHS